MEQTNKAVQLLLALTPLVVLIILLGLNLDIEFDNDAFSVNQVILLFSALIAALLGLANGAKARSILDKVVLNIKDTKKAIFILLLILSYVCILHF